MTTEEKGEEPSLKSRDWGSRLLRGAVGKQCPLSGGWNAVS